MGRLDVHIRHGHGGDGAGAWAALAGLVALAVIGGAARHLIATTLHVVVTVLEVIAWTLAGAAAAAVLTGGALASVRIRRAVLAARARRAAVPRVPVIHITPEGYLRPLPDPASPARPALSPPPQQPATSWPLPGWWEEIRPHIGGDDDQHRPH
jgi:hypothetical protein